MQIARRTGSFKSSISDAGRETQRKRRIVKAATL